MQPAAPAQPLLQGWYVKCVEIYRENWWSMMDWKILIRISLNLIFSLKDCSEFFCIFPFPLTWFFSPRLIVPTKYCLKEGLSNYDIREANHLVSVVCSSVFPVIWHFSFCWCLPHTIKHLWGEFTNRKKINDPIFVEKWLVIYYFSSGKVQLWGRWHRTSSQSEKNCSSRGKALVSQSWDSTVWPVWQRSHCGRGKVAGTWPPFVLSFLLVLESFPGQHQEWQVALRAASRERCQGCLRCRAQGSPHLLFSQFCHSLLLYRPGSKAWGDETTSQKICRW